MFVSIRIQRKQPSCTEQQTYAHGNITVVPLCESSGFREKSCPCHFHPVISEEWIPLSATLTTAVALFAISRIRIGESFDFSSLLRLIVP
eukprot:g12122.t1